MGLIKILFLLFFAFIVRNLIQKFLIGSETVSVTKKNNSRFPDAIEAEFKDITDSSSRT